MSLIPARCPPGLLERALWNSALSLLQLLYFTHIQEDYFMLSHSSAFFIRRESWSRDLELSAELCRMMMTFNSMVICPTLCRNCHTSNKTQNKWSSNYPEGITKALQVTRKRQGLCGKVSHQPQEGVMSTGHCTDLLRLTDTVSIPSLSPCQCQLYKTRKQ